MRGDLLELHDALGIGHFVNAVDDWRMPACSRCAATASLAASMNSSMMRLAMLRGRA